MKGLPTLFVRWYRRRPVASPPSPAIKHRIVRDYGRRHHLETFVETGTYLGDMAAAASRWFTDIYTIELDPSYAEHARQRFASLSNVHVYEGDSGVLLPEILSSLVDPVLFWLDAHHLWGTSTRGETDTPIAKELRVVLSRSSSDVVLVDDARYFGTGDYPSLDEVAEMARAAGRSIDVDLDIIRIT